MARRYFPTSKTIDGKRYNITGVSSNKTKAKRRATNLRKQNKLNARVIASGKTKGSFKAPIKRGYNFSQTTGPKRGRYAVYTRSKEPRRRRRK